MDFPIGDHLDSNTENKWRDIPAASACSSLGSCPGMCLFFQPPNLISHHCSAFNSKVQERAPEAVAWLTLLTELAGSNSDRTPTADSWSRWSLISEQALSSPAALLWRPNGKFYYQVLAFEWELCYKFSYLPLAVSRFENNRVHVSKTSAKLLILTFEIMKMAASVLFHRSVRVSAGHRSFVTSRRIASKWNQEKQKRPWWSGRSHKPWGLLREFWGFFVFPILRHKKYLRRSNQSTLKEIKPEYSLEGLLLNLKP